MKIVFDITDKTGRKIHLSEERYKHILKHPNMQDNLENIKSTILNVTAIRYNEEAEREFSNFEKEIGLKYLEFKEDFFNEGSELFSKVINSKIKIRKASTFLMDCVNLATIINNNVSVLFSNDEDLEVVCRKFLKKIQIIKIQPDSSKVIKDYFKSQKKSQKLKK